MGQIYSVLFININPQSLILGFIFIFVVSDGWIEIFVIRCNVYAMRWDVMENFCVHCSTCLFMVFFLGK